MNKEKDIIESYNKFLSQIGPNYRSNNNLKVKILFIISIFLFLYSVITVYGEDLYLESDIFTPFYGMISLIASLCVFVIAWKKRNKIEYNNRKNYKSIFENCLKIKWNDLPIKDEELFKNENKLYMRLNEILPEDADLNKLIKKEYVDAGFNYADDKYDYFYESSEEIILNDSAVAYLVQIGKLVGDRDVPHYIVDGWIIKQKTNINIENYVFDIEKLISKFNLKYNYNLDNKIEVKSYNGYLYIYIDKLSLYFLYSALIKYDTYKEIYLKIKLLKDISNFFDKEVININDNNIF